MDGRQKSVNMMFSISSITVYRSKCNYWEIAKSFWQTRSAEVQTLL